MAHHKLHQLNNTVETNALLWLVDGWASNSNQVQYDQLMLHSISSPKYALSRKSHHEVQHTKYPAKSLIY